MSHAAKASIHRLPALLLLGLLALLLWGQCALNINDHGRYVPTVSVRVTHDSLSTATKGQPARLYLTLLVTNHLEQTCRLDTALGNVSFDKQYWNFVAPKVHGLELPPHGNRLIPVMLSLVPPVDSVVAFQKALRTGSRYDNKLRVYLRATYATANEPDRWWPVEASTYLPAQRQR
ncbi:MAG: hypothetical protein ACRYFZ_16695 [Janthinobacterium lividum]